MPLFTQPYLLYALYSSDNMLCKFDKRNKYDGFVAGCGLTEAIEATGPLVKDSADYPWVVTITGKDDTKCQGALVSEDWIIVSSRCVPDLNQLVSVSVDFNPA